MTEVSFLAADLAKWDFLSPLNRPSAAPEPAGSEAPELLVLPFFADERPLRGAAGLCDWRLCGRLSRLLQKGRVTGEFAETTLYPPGRRLAFPRLLLFGLGLSAAFDEAKARAAAPRIVASVGKMGAERYALAPPGRSMGRLSARRALEIYLEEAQAAGALTGQLVVIESPAGQKEAADLVRKPATQG